MIKIIRRAIAILLSATAVILLLLPAGDVNATYTKGDYIIDGGTLVSYTGDDPDITIPLGITSIGKDAFSNNQKLRSVYIPDEVSSIDYAAFENCKNLEKVDIGDGVKSIGQSAFSGCLNLSDVNIPRYVESIGSGAFAACPNLSNVSIDEKNRNYVCLDGVIYTRDGQEMVQYLAGRPYSTYQIPEPVKEIGEFSFYGANMLTSVSIVHGVSEIPEYAFLNCTALNNVEIPGSVKAIRKGAFGGCPNLTKLQVPTSVGYIDDEAFTSMDGKKGDVVNETTGEVLSESGDETAPSSDISDVRQDDSETESDENQQNPTDDEASKPISLPKEIVSSDGQIGATTIVGGNAVLLMNPKEMKVYGFDMDAAQTEDSIADSGNSSSEGEDIRANSGREFDIIGNGFGHYGGDSSDITLPDGITKVGNRVFYNNKNINTVDLPSSVNEIGDFAFARSSLKMIDIPDGTEKIGYAAFYNCNDLERVNVPGSVKSIELGAFDGTRFINNWKSIEDGNNFLVLGDGILVAYKGHGTEVVIPNSVKKIGPGVFSGSTRIKSVVIPESVETICEDAFNGCTKLNNISLPKNLTKIEDRAFKDTGLNNVTIPLNVREIGLGAFDTSRINGGMDTVVFKGVTLPNVTYKPTATRLSASNLRTNAFNGTEIAFIPEAARIDSGNIFDSKYNGFRGQAYSENEDSADGISNVVLRSCTKEPDEDGVVNIDAELKIGKKNYYLAGVSETAFDSYIDPFWCKTKPVSIAINGNNSNALNELIDDTNKKIGSESTNSFSEPIKIEVLDSAINSNNVKASLSSQKERFRLIIENDNSIINDFNNAFDNRYGNHDGIKMHPLSISMTDKTGVVPIKKMSTNKLDITLPVPSDFASYDKIRVATLDDNGLLEELSCEVDNTDEINKNVTFVASHLSPFILFVRESDISSSDEENEGGDDEINVISTEEMNGAQAFAANTVTTIGGEVVYGTLQKEVAPGIPVRYFVISLLFGFSFVLLFLNRRKIKNDSN